MPCQNTVSTGSQYHFHMETQTCVAIPEEGDKMKVISATQWPSMMQNLISRVTGVNSSKITGNVFVLSTEYDTN